MVRASLKNILQNDSRDHIHASFEFLVFVDRTISSIDFQQSVFFLDFQSYIKKGLQLDVLYIFYICSKLLPRKGTC